MCALKCTVVFQPFCTHAILYIKKLHMHFKATMTGDFVQLRFLQAFKYILSKDSSINEK